MKYRINFQRTNSMEVDQRPALLTSTDPLTANTIQQRLAQHSESLFEMLIGRCCSLVMT